MASEEAKVIKAENSKEILSAFNRIPYALINAEVKGTAKDTLDESPMSYKNMDDIVNNISPTAEIIKIIKPIYNFKAAE